MNAIELGLRHVLFNIPRPILELTFQNLLKQGVSLENCIRSKVINEKVRQDCDLLGGRYKAIRLDPAYALPLPPTKDDMLLGVNSFSLFRIPPEERDNADIVSVRHIAPEAYLSNAGLNVFNTDRGSDLLGMVSRVLAAHTANDYVVTPTGEVIGNDIIRISPSIYSMGNWWVAIVHLAYDEDLTGLTNDAIIVFRNLLLLATKVYIYINLIVELDAGKITFGREIGNIQSIVESYSDAGEQYTETLDRFSMMVRYTPERMRTLLEVML